jgi:magnesium-transporting ATPase (P-type)
VQLVCFYIPYAVYGFSTTQSVTGRDSGSISEMGTCIVLSATIAANSMWSAIGASYPKTPTDYTGLLTKYWTKLYTSLLILSTLTAWLWVIIYSAFPYQLKSIDIMLFSTAPFFATLVLIQVVCVLPRYTYMYIQSTYFPRDIDIIREAVGACHDLFLQGTNDVRQFSTRDAWQWSRPHTTTHPPPPRSDTTLRRQYRPCPAVPTQTSTSPWTT